MNFNLAKLKARHRAERAEMQRRVLLLWQTLREQQAKELDAVRPSRATRAQRKAWIAVGLCHCGSLLPYHKLPNLNGTIQFYVCAACEPAKRAEQGLPPIN